MSAPGAGERGYTAQLQQRVTELECEVARLRSSSGAAESAIPLIHRLMDDAPVGFALLDTDLRYKLVNHKLAEMNGLPASSHVGRTLEEIVPETAAEAREALGKVIATGKPILDLELSAPDGTGAVRYWAKSLFPVTAEDGKLLGVGVLVAEITGQKRAIEEARISQQRLELAQAAAGIASWEWDLHTNEVYWSAECGPLYGLDRGSNLTYEQWFEAVLAVDRESVRTEIGLVLDGRDDYETQFRVVWPNGSVHWLLSKGRVQRGADGKAVRVFGINMDITERKEAEQSTRESERRFQNMADTAPVMICASGPNGSATFFNRGWLQFTGRTMEQEVGSGWSDNIHPDDRKRALAEIESAFEARRYCQAEYRLLRRDGEYRWILCHGTPRYELDGEFTGYVASAIDVTDYKLAHEAELARQKMASIGMIAAGVAHDLNNLMASIAAESYLAQSEVPAGSAAAEGLTRVNLLAGRAAEISQELMAYAANDTPSFETLDISRVVQDMLELLRVSISKRAILDVRLEKNLRPVSGNTSQLRQLVLNLITNASEALEGHAGTIKLSTSAGQVTPLTSPEFEPNLATGDYVRLEVSDTGGGMTDETRARIFDPFFSTKVQGRGLGLAVVQRVVRGHGGGIRITSSRLDGGTRFEVLLPCTQESAIATGGAGSVTGVSQSRRKQGAVLVVDDETSLRRPVSEMLQREGFTVHEAADGPAAVKTFAAHVGKIGVVLLDITMPGMSGIEVLSELRRIRPDIRVILNTAYSSVTLQDDIDEHSVWRFIRKPYHFGDLVNLLRRALDEATDSES